MSNSKPPAKPEINEYLSKESLKAAVSAGDLELLYQHVIGKVKAFENDLQEYHKLKTINENDMNSQEDKDMFNDLSDLGF